MKARTIIAASSSRPPNTPLGFALLALGLLLIPLSVGPQSVPSADSVGEEHIRQLIHTLPPDSSLRRELEGGARGNGKHYAWMDNMRQAGVKRATVSTSFLWRGRPTNVTASRIVYFSEYDSDCSQITDPDRLGQIRGSHVEEEISKAALQFTADANWLFIDKRPKVDRGVSGVEFLDDEWLPRNPVGLGPAPKKPQPFLDAVGLDDVEGVKALVQTGLDPKERDTAFWAILLRDAPCMMRALLAAGADANLRDRYGVTVLMAAVRYRTLANVKALLAAGADVNARDSQGVAPLAIARREQDPQIIQMLRDAGARD